LRTTTTKTADDDHNNKVYDTQRRDTAMAPSKQHHRETEQEKNHLQTDFFKRKRLGRPKKKGNSASDCIIVVKLQFWKSSGEIDCSRQRMECRNWEGR
jgi:hypothetical protein